MNKGVGITIALLVGILIGATGIHLWYLDQESAKELTEQAPLALQPSEERETPPSSPQEEKGETETLVINPFIENYKNPEGYTHREETFEKILVNAVKNPESPYQTQYYLQEVLETIPLSENPSAETICQLYDWTWHSTINVWERELAERDKEKYLDSFTKGCTHVSLGLNNETSTDFQAVCSYFEGEVFKIEGPNTNTGPGIITAVIIPAYTDWRCLLP